MRNFDYGLVLRALSNNKSVEESDSMVLYARKLLRGKKKCNLKHSFKGYKK